MKGTAILVLFTLFIASIYCQCSYTNATSGDTFDFSDLTLEDSAGSNFYTATYSNGDIFYWNICGSVSSKYCTKSPGTAVCQNSAGVEWNCGLLSTQAWSSGVQNGESYVSVTYTNGDTCTGQTGQPKRTTIIGLHCGDGGNSVFGESACTYQLRMDTQDACIGGGGGVKVGWVGLTIMIVVILLFILYFVIGIIIKWKKYEATGIDLIPNVDFWKDVPFLFKDGWVFTINKITCGKVCGGYSSI